MFDPTLIVARHFAVQPPVGSRIVAEVMRRDSNGDLLVHITTGGYTARITAAGNLYIPEGPGQEPVRWAGLLPMPCWQGRLPAHLSPEAEGANEVLAFVEGEISAGRAQPALVDGARVKVPCDFLMSMAKRLAEVDPSSPLISQAYAKMGLAA